MSPLKCAPMPAMNTMLPKVTTPLKSGGFSGGLPFGHTTRLTGFWPAVVCAFAAAGSAAVAAATAAVFARNLRRFDFIDASMGPPEGGHYVRPRRAGTESANHA